MEAPPQSLASKKPGAFVIGAGLATSELSLVLVHLIGVVAHGYQIMGLHVDFIIPLGALLVGCLAGSGYGAASWLSGVKISRSLMWTVVAAQVLVFVSAHYIQFSHLAMHHADGQAVGFLEYYDHLVRSFAWVRKDGSVGEPLGAWGYAFHLLEVAGFTVGGLIVPAILFRQPYCTSCQLYMRSRELCRIPAGVAPRTIARKDAAGRMAYEEELERAAREGGAALSALCSEAERGRSLEFLRQVEALAGRKRATHRLSARIVVRLVSCRCCHGGHLQPLLVSGRGKHTRRTPLEQVPLPVRFVEEIAR